ncbi:hypothetical protein CD798_14150 [Bacillaceae bacterium SAOS 7]|nr:hypothetical protein CD798_14150 [Bacillaceae bacterium SAOS 7]
MKLGLICNNDIRNQLLEEIESLGIELFQDADLYIVEDGLHHSFNACIVFNPNDPNKLFDILQMLSSKSATSKIVGMHNEEYYVIHHDQILFFEADGSSVVCHTAAQMYRMREKLYQLEERLPSDKFVKVSRSFIVNIDSVTKIIPWFNRKLLLKFDPSKKEVEVSKNHVGHFKKFLGMR